MRFPIKELKSRLFLKLKLNHSGRPTRQIIGCGIDILIIAPGEMPIPNNGWGAVEFLVWKQYQNFANTGIQTGILNSWFHRDWLKAYRRRPKVILLHYDIFAKRCFFYKVLFPRTPVFVVSHFGYSAFPEKFGRGFSKQLHWINKMSVIIALNQQIREVWRQLGVTKNIIVIGNGADVSDFRSPAIKDRDVIYLGKVEPRKRQIEVAQTISDAVQIDFVGPIVDLNFEQLKLSLANKFLGSWTREEVNLNLGRYKVLLLWSDGEADALVLYEAQAAGCSIVVSRNALGNQNPLLPWIYIVEDLNQLESTLLLAIKQNKLFKNTILEYATREYSWQLNSEKLVEILKPYWL
jgi:glycosyltransferase involved in cell wall biosynthesis